MGRQAEFKERKTIGITLEAEELKVLDEIRWREHKERAKLGRDIIVEYLKTHKAGNDTFTLNNWVDDKDFMAIPALGTHDQNWRKYLNNCGKKDFFRTLSTLSKTRQIAIDIMNSRGLKNDE